MQPIGRTSSRPKPPIATKQMTAPTDRACSHTQPYPNPPFHSPIGFTRRRNRNRILIRIRNCNCSRSRGSACI
ncbi:unnamed protein product [Soboliphyme baturini]|uniref:Uncharacterized protein n=1 Tax=Soboliphyme baturini TaxID=241478 RepID=A0A183IJ93_9BILA|nr:unnamed protein product [Soboliphyme baturini]